MVLFFFFHCIASAGLVVVEYACASLIFTSFANVPSLGCLDLGYLNWLTFSSVFPIIHNMLVDGLSLLLLTRILLLSELISLGGVLPYCHWVRRPASSLLSFVTK